MLLLYCQILNKFCNFFRRAKLLKLEAALLIVKLSKIKKGLQLSNPFSADRTGLQILN